MQQRKRLNFVKNIEVGSVTTFEWQRVQSGAGASRPGDLVQHGGQCQPAGSGQLMLAAHSNGKISLINTNQPDEAGRQARGNGQAYRYPAMSMLESIPGGFSATNPQLAPPKIEKVFVTAGMVQNTRHCNTLAWNRCNPQIFAAGYDSSGPAESSLLIWDIEKDMNKHLKNVRKEEEQMLNYRLRDVDKQLYSDMADVTRHDYKQAGHYSVTLGHLESNMGPQIVTECLYSFPNIVADIYSVEWLPDSENELICATEDQILLCDTRQSFKKENIFQLSHESKSKCHFSSIKFDPFWNSRVPTNRRFAAYTDDEIFIIDLRKSNQVLSRIRSDSLSEMEDELMWQKQRDLREQRNEDGANGRGGDDKQQNASSGGQDYWQTGKRDKLLVSPQFLPFGDDHNNKIVSKQFSGFAWCLSRENLLVTYSNFKGQSKIKFWDIKSEMIFGEQGRLDGASQQQRQLADDHHDHGNKSPQSFDSMSHENLKVNQQPVKHQRGKQQAESELLTKKLAQTLQQNSGPFRWQQNTAFQQLFTPNLLSKEYKSVECAQRIHSLVWKPANVQGKYPVDKSKFLIYTGDGQIQEMSFNERKFATLALSSKGELCMSVSNPREAIQSIYPGRNVHQMQTISLISQRELQIVNDDQFKYSYWRMLTGKNQAAGGSSEPHLLQNTNQDGQNFPKHSSPHEQQSLLNQNLANMFGPMPPSKYSEAAHSQSIGLLTKEISQLMLLRIQGGYHVDSIYRNCVLANGFIDAHNLYSLYQSPSPQRSSSSSRSRKKASQSSLLSAENTRSVRSFWKFISRVRDLAIEEWLVQNESQKIDSSNDLMGFAPPSSQLGRHTSSLMNLHQIGQQPSSTTNTQQAAQPPFGPNQQPWISLLSDGLNGLLTQAMQTKRQEMGVDATDADKVAAKLDEEREQWYEFEVYTASYRRQVVRFCGWGSEVVVPRFMVGTAGSAGGAGGGRRCKDYEELERIREELMRCCDAAKQEDGSLPADAAMDAAGDDCTRHPLPGSASRVTVMCCLHFDFQQALGLFTGSRSQGPPENGPMMGANNISQIFAEEQTNLNIFENILHCLSEVQRVPPAPPVIGPKPRMQQNPQTILDLTLDLMNQKVAMIKDMNKNLHTQMKSPYLEAFFKLLDRNQWSDLFSYWDQSQPVMPKIDVMDYFALMFRFLPLNELVECLRDFELTGTREGRLEVLIVTGLNSPNVFALLQNFVDRTSDLQTAAYVAAYAINIQQASGLVPSRQKNKLGKFIRAYQDYLNQMQLWSARSVFDQKLGQIARSGGQLGASQLLMTDSQFNFKQQKNAVSSGAEDSNHDGAGHHRDGPKAADRPGRSRQINQAASLKIDDEESGQLLILYSQYLQRQEKQSQKILATALGTTQGDQSNINNKSDNQSKQQNFKQNLQKNQQDLTSNNMYEDRHLESDIVCYFCGGSFSLKKQIEKFNQKSRGNNVMGSFQMGQPAMMGGMGRPAGGGSHSQNAELQKPLSNRCVCDREVPCCSVCIKPLDLINPHYEIIKQNETKRRLKASQPGGQPSFGMPGLGGMRAMHGQGGVSSSGQSSFMPMSMNSFGNFGMGSQLSWMQNKADDPNTDIQSNQQLSNWLIWCQTCKHGGHAQHLTEWFLNFTVCPVSDCNCECSKI